VEGRKFLFKSLGNEIGFMESEKELENSSQAAVEPEAKPQELTQQETGSALLGDLPAAYQKLLAEKQELYDRLLRKQAELENSRKRMQREKEEFLQHANFDLIRALLPVLDGFDRAFRQRDSSIPAQFYEGLDLIHRQLLDTLGRAGLTVIESKGETFDPAIHQAVETVEDPQHRDHEIVEELQRGYRLKQRLLRPALVKVAVQPHGQGAHLEGNKRGERRETTNEG
jgi:molecular chaperone GrpE